MTEEKDSIQIRTDQLNAVIKSSEVEANKDKKWLDELENIINKSEEAYITMYQGNGDYEYTELEDLYRLIAMARKAEESRELDELGEKILIKILAAKVERYEKSMEKLKQGLSTLKEMIERDSRDIENVSLESMEWIGTMVEIATEALEKSNEVKRTP